MLTYLIKNGTLISPSDGYTRSRGDIYLENGKIKDIGESLNYECQTLDAQGLIVSPGFIDIHTHCFTGTTALGVDADTIGVNRGTTTILDAGSAGPDTIETFIKEVVKTHKTRVYSLLNISKNGLIERNELNNLDKIDLDKVRTAVSKYPEVIVGLKARASSSVVGDLEIIPIKMATDIATELNQILMVHTGNFPPYLQDVLNLMKKDDVLTHAFHGKEGGILNQDQEIIDEAIKARDRGVLFDVGHGSASFSFATFKKARVMGFNADFVSTDLHCENYDELVYSQHAVITKLINIGEDLIELIDKATARPADHFKLNHIGHLRVGYEADLTISKLIETDECVQDSMGNTLELKQKLVPIYTIVGKNGRVELINNESK